MSVGKENLEPSDSAITTKIISYGMEFFKLINIF